MSCDKMKDSADTEKWPYDRTGRHTFRERLQRYLGVSYEISEKINKDDFRIYGCDAG